MASGLRRDPIYKNPEFILGTPLCKIAFGQVFNDLCGNFLKFLLSAQNQVWLQSQHPWSARGPAAPIRHQAVRPPFYRAKWTVNLSLGFKATCSTHCINPHNSRITYRFTPGTVLEFFGAPLALVIVLHAFRLKAKALINKFTVRICSNRPF